MNRLGAKLKEAKASLRSRSKSQTSSLDVSYDGSVAVQPSGSASASSNKAPTVSVGSTASKAVDESGARSNKIWDIALNSLSDDQRKVLLETSSNPDTKLDLLQKMLDATEKRETECKSRNWKLKLGQDREIIVADQASKIIRWLNKFKAVGDIVINHDLVHSALPWAAVRFLLVVR